MPKTRVQKIEAVQVLTDKLSKAKSVVFADYKGLKMSQLSDLRNKLREQNAEFSITKNAILKLVLKSTDYLPVRQAGRLPTTEDRSQKTEDILNGPTATLFAYDDQITPIKTLVKAFKDYTFGKVKSGFLGTDVLTEEKIIQLSTLPTKDELKGKVVGVLAAPLTGIVSLLQGNLKNLVYALSEIQKQRGGV